MLNCHGELAYTGLVAATASLSTLFILLRLICDCFLLALQDEVPRLSHRARRLRFTRASVPSLHRIRRRASQERTRANHKDSCQMECEGQSV